MILVVGVVDGVVVVAVFDVIVEDIVAISVSV